MEIDHITVPVRNYEAAKAFYADALKPLGFEILLDWHDRRRAYLGIPPGPSSVWIAESTFAGTADLAFAVEDEASVIAFHTAALASGARSLGEPGIREEFGSGYYAARIADFDGNEIEAVRRVPASARVAA